MCDDSKLLCESLVSSSNLCMDQDMYPGGSPLPPSSPRGGCPSPAEAKAFPSYHVEVIRHSAPPPGSTGQRPPPPRGCNEITSCNRSWSPSGPAPPRGPVMQQESKITSCNRTWSPNAAPRLIMQQGAVKQEVKIEELPLDISIRTTTSSSSGEGTMGPPTHYRPRRPSGGEFARPRGPLDVVSRSGDLRAMHLAAAAARYNPGAVARRLQDLPSNGSSGSRPDDPRPPELSTHHAQDGGLLVMPSSSSGGAGAPLPRVSIKKERRKEDDVSSSIPDLEFDGTTVLCRVCGDKASGFHYGVHSCEGCKGFFRRSIQQKIQYRPCTKNQQCSILRINRNRCQYCRLKKCIAVGMSRDAVRFGRVPKREKAKILAAMHSVNARSQEKAVLAELEDDQRVTQAIIRAHMDTCDFTRDKVQPMLQQARHNPSYTQCPPTLACPLNPSPVPMQGQQQLLQDFSERFSPAIRGVVEFAKRLPGFQQLCQEDQVTLLKAGVFEVLLARLAGMFDSRSNTMLCLNGQLLRREALQSSPNARFLMDSMFDFAERVNHLDLTDHELAIFCAIVILAPDRPGLRNPGLVENVQRRLVICLQAVTNKHHPENLSLHFDLLNKIPDLRTLNTLHSEKLLAFKMTEHTAAGSSWDDSRSSWSLGSEDKDSGVGSPVSSCHDDIMRSPVSCSDSVYSGESGSSSESVCGNEVTSYGYTDLRPPFPNRRRRDLSEGASSGDEASESSLKCPFSKRKSESPDDSGIESGTDRSDKLSSPSVCSSPRSSIDEKSEEDREDDMPVLRRALQAPPIINTDLLMEEAYKPHKKFRAATLRREEEPHSSQSIGTSILAQTLSQPPQMSNPSSLASTHSTLAASLASTSLSPSLAASHSTLARTLLEGPKMSENDLRRADMLHSMIMRTEPRERLSSPSSRSSPGPYYVPQACLERLQMPTTSWTCPPRSSSASSSSSDRSSPMQSSITSQPRVHLLTTPTPSRYYVPKLTATPVGMGAQPSSSPGVSSSPQPQHQLQGIGAVPQRVSPSPLMELQVDIADSQPLNLSKKTPPPTPQEFILEA